MSSLFKLSDAGGSVIQIRTREPLRAAAILRKSLQVPGESNYKEWDTTNGWRTFTPANYTDNKIAGDSMEFLEALAVPISQLRDESSALNSDKAILTYYAFVNPHPFMAENPFSTQYLQQYASILPQTNACILLITPDISLDSLPAGTVLVTEMKTPNVDELATLLDHLLPGEDSADFDAVELDDEDKTKISLLGLGLTWHEFETHVSVAQIEASIANERTLTVDHLMAGVSKGKTEVVKQSEILELYPSDSIENVGGMRRLKDWVNSRALCYSDEAKDFGVEAPKGMVLVGVPGSGKSLAAKAVSSVLGVPLVRMDFGRVFSKFIGDSESRVRSALAMVEAMAPCVLFVDEIDKGLGGIGGGGGDSGTSSRVLGSFLTWLQDCKAPVFVMVTANKVDGLPPELLRRGRFDAIFSVGLPTATERTEVLAIHLRKRDRDIADFSKSEIALFVAASDKYVPAEIESSVKDALILAFNEGVPMTMAHVITSLNDMVPLSKSYAAQIDAIVAWAAANATPVNYPVSVEAINEATKAISHAARRAPTRRKAS